MVKTRNILIATIAVLLGIWSCSSKKTLPVELIRRPYLQCALSDSVTVLWRTDTGSHCQVAFRPDTEVDWLYAQGTTRKTNTGLIENEVVLKGLEPDIRYEYRIFTEDQELMDMDSLWFHSPKTVSDTVLTFFAAGDVGEPIADGGTPDKLAKALASTLENQDFGVLLGDIVYPEGRSEVYDAHLFDHFGAVFPYVPLFTLLGNHDWHEPQDNYLQEWKLPHNEYYYSFDYANAHFTALDSKEGDFYEYEKQVTWLEEDLKSAAGKDWRIVLLHHNGKSCTYKEDYERVIALYPLFEKYGVDLVLNGHAHTYERLNPMNGLGEVLPQYLENTDVYERPEGFISITVGSGGKLRGIGSDPTPYTPDPENCRHPQLVAAADHLWAYLQISIKGKTLEGKTIATEDLREVDHFVIRK